jgi:hypothetical protein
MTIIRERPTRLSRPTWREGTDFPLRLYWEHEADLAAASGDVRSSEKDERAACSILDDIDADQCTNEQAVGAFQK